MKEKKTQGMTVRESSTSYNTKENIISIRKPTLTDQREQEGKIGFVAVFTDITRRGGNTRGSIHPYS